MATVTLVYPRASTPLQRRLEQRWSRQLIEMLGVRLTATGALVPAGRLLVANHVSWLDIFAINALAPVPFVCKADVREWPVIGWLVARTETIFLERGSRAAAQRASTQIASLLARGEAVAVFPEGTSTDGTRLLDFKAALFQPAIDAGATVQPLALRYVDASGATSLAPAYFGDVTLWETLVALACADGLRAELDTGLAPIPTVGSDRRTLAQAARLAIVQSLPFTAREATDTDLRNGLEELAPAVA